MDTRNLPIAESREAILQALRHHQVIVVAGETGCGKTTQVPQYLLDAGYAHLGVVGVTEPRRVAAMSVAEWVAECRGGKTGEEVGYKIRHEKFADPRTTKLEYMTEGVLLREMQGDPRLSRYSVIVVDEVHERGLNQDVILAHLKQLLRERADLRVVVMSATIAEQDFAEYFGGAPIVKVPGRMFPVEMRYLARDPVDEVEAALRAVPKLFAETEGDLLVFVPDYRSIGRLLEGLPSNLPADAEVLPLYGDQDPPEQRRVVFGRDPSVRHVIIATNVAETSVTLDGVTAVVDTGLVKVKDYRPGQAFSTLKARPHSRAGLDQRAGRAGRTAPGICLRLMSEDGYLKRPKYSRPEILRTGLDEVLLHLLSLGFVIDDVAAFGWLTPPRPEMWADAREQLELLGAMARNGALTETGRFMSELPLPPCVSKMILAAERGRCVDAVVTIAASFGTRPVFLRPPGEEDAADEAHLRFLNKHSDFLTVLRTVEAWRGTPVGERESFCAECYLNHRALSEIEAVTRQIRVLLEERGVEVSCRNDPVAVGKAVTAGLARNLMVRSKDDSRIYHAAHRHGIYFSPDSALAVRENFPELAVCAEICETTRAFARRVQSVQAKWLAELGITTRQIKPPRREPSAKKQKPCHERPTRKHHVPKRFRGR